MVILPLQSPPLYSDILASYQVYNHQHNHLVSSCHYEGGESWYGARDLQEKIKVDEFLDFWQSSFNPVALKLVQNKLMWKVVSLYL